MWSSLQHLWFLISLPEVAIWPLIFGTCKTFQQEPPQVRLWLKSRRSHFCLPGKVIHELDKALSSAWAWTTEGSPRLQTPWRGLDDPFPWVCFSRNRGSWYMGFHGGEDLQYFGCTERFWLLWLIRLLGLYFSEVINAAVMPGSSLSNSTATCSDFSCGLMALCWAVWESYGASLGFQSKGRLPWWRWWLFIPEIYHVIYHIVRQFCVTCGITARRGWSTHKPGFMGTGAP